MKKIFYSLAISIAVFACSDPKVQEDLKKLREDHEQLRKDHEQLRQDHNTLIKDAIKAEVKVEDNLEGSKMD